MLKPVKSKLKFILKGIFKSKYISINDNTVVLKNHLLSISKHEYSIRDILITIIPKCVTPDVKKAYGKIVVKSMEKGYTSKAIEEAYNLLLGTDLKSVKIKYKKFKMQGISDFIKKLQHNISSWSLMTKKEDNFVIIRTFSQRGDSGLRIGSTSNAGHIDTGNEELNKHFKQIQRFRQPNIYSLIA